MPKYSFGSRSLKNLNTCHSDIKLILNELIKFYDFSVISGIRTDAEQQALFKDGKSKLDGINQKSKHQGKEDSEGNIVSFAADICPYKSGHNPFENSEDNWRRYFFLMGMVYAISNKLLEEGKITHKIRFGIDWQMDMVYNHNQEFFDAPHFELIKGK